MSRPKQMNPHSSARRELLAGIGSILLAGDSMAQNSGPAKFPDILAASVRKTGQQTFDFDVTVSSPYDTPARYADALRVMSESGVVYGERKLLHDHQHEQPFTRDLYGVEVPAGIKHVIVQGRDQQSGYGGKSIVVKLPGR